MLLIAVSNGDWCEIIPMTRETPITFGRVASNDVAIHNSCCSRHHAVIAFHEGDWYLKDLNSSNGTWLNGYAITRPVRLESGDRIRITDREFQITSPDSLTVSQPVDSLELSSDGVL